ncbi:hypothetical protein PBN151_3646 [Paenibacillus sp. NAIST15-1]|nr:hypothetical protein PBN151_3646 [Paenibacillus sp. NAIST15-1]
MSKNEFVYLYNIYQNIDESIDILLRISISHVYTEIERYGEDSLKNWRGLSMS